MLALVWSSDAAMSLRCGDVPTLLSAALELAGLWRSQRKCLRGGLSMQPATLQTTEATDSPPNRITIQTKTRNTASVAHRQSVLWCPAACAARARTCGHCCERVLLLATATEGFLFPPPLLLAVQLPAGDRAHLACCFLPEKCGLCCWVRFSNTAAPCLAGFVPHGWHGRNDPENERFMIKCDSCRNWYHGRLGHSTTHFAISAARTPPNHLRDCAIAHLAHAVRASFQKPSVTGKCGCGVLGVRDWDNCCCCTVHGQRMQQQRTRPRSTPPALLSLCCAHNRSGVCTGHWHVASLSDRL